MGLREFTKTLYGELGGSVWEGQWRHSSHDTTSASRGTGADSPPHGLLLVFSYVIKDGPPLTAGVMHLPARLRSQDSANDDTLVPHHVPVRTEGEESA